jgi:hypothetical protein
MAGEDYEPNRVLGIPVRGPRSGGGDEPPARRDEEPQRVMGFPVDLFSGPSRGRPGLESLAHPVRRYRQWRQRRRLGPFEVDGDERPRQS